MSCPRTREIDLAAYVVEPQAPEWVAFREHLPGCPDCGAALREWTQLELGLGGLRGAGAAAAHPSPESLARFEATPQRLGTEERRGIEAHLLACRTCADELRALRGFDFAAATEASDATRRASDVLGDLARGAAELGGRARDWIAGRAAELLPGPEPAFVFQSAAERPEVTSPGRPVALALLVVTGGSRAGESLPIVRGALRIGRGSACELRIDLPDLPDVAAVLDAAPGRFALRVPGDPTLVRVNGATAPVHELQDGDVLEIASLRFRLAVLDAA
jgi:hypothetical protein